MHQTNSVQIASQNTESESKQMEVASVTQKTFERQQQLF